MSCRTAKNWLNWQDLRPKYLFLALVWILTYWDVGDLK